MNNELDSKLCSKYPKMFADRYADMKTTAMCWGFEHGDGWYNILDALCGNIQNHIDWSIKNNQFDIDYNKMIADMQAGNFDEFDKKSSAWAPEYRERMREEYLNATPRVVREPVSQVVLQQVKEKFGTLRFYYSGGDEQIYGMVRMAESMSAVTCEECGNPGRSRRGGWIRTLCDKHAEEAGYYTTEDDEDGC